jgi:hypothetical protein
MANEPSFEELNAAFGHEDKRPEPSYEELSKAFGEPTLEQRNASADDAMSGPEGQKLRGELQNEANRRVVEQEGYGPGSAAVASGLNTAFLNAPRNLKAYVESTRSGKPFQEEYERQRRLEEAAEQQYPKASALGSAAGIVGQGLMIPAAAPESILGRTLLGRSVAGGLTGGALEGGKTYADTKNPVEAALAAAKGAALGLAAAPVVEKLAAPAARFVGEKAGAIAPKIPIPNKEELFDMARKAYEKSENAGVMIKPEAIKQLHGDIEQELANKGYHPKNTPEIKPALDELYKLTIPSMNGMPNYTTLKGLDTINQIARSASTSINPQSRLMGGIFHEKLNDFLDNLAQHHVITGNAPDAVESLKNARHLWKTARKTEEIENLLDTAGLRAASTGSGGNINNTIRQEVRKLIERDRKKPGRWTPDELHAMRAVAKGGLTQNAARLVGKLSPGGNGLTMMLELGAALHNPGTLLAPVVGHIAKHSADKATHAGMHDLKNLVISGGFRKNMPDALPSGIQKLENVGVSGEVGADRQSRAKGGRVDKRDYPAKKQSKLEKQADRTLRALGGAMTPLMDLPDHVVANALRVAKQ